MASKTTDWRPGPTVCRCCLSEGCYKDIATEYFWMGKREVYAEMLSETFSLSIAFSQSGGPNSNSRLICEPCISRLRDASDFRRQVQECEKTFMNYLDPGSSVTDLDVTVESVEAEVKVECVKLENDGSDDDFEDRVALQEDEDDEDDMDDQPLTKLVSKVPKKESVDVMELLDGTKSGEKRKTSAKAKASATKKSKGEKKVKATSSKQPKPEKKKKGADQAIIPDKTRQKRIVPLFQVAYDRTLCRPLGTISDFSKLTRQRKTPTISAAIRKVFTPSRSPSPISLGGKSPSSLRQEAPELSIITATKPKQKLPDVRQNALTIFEFSTVYPFIYGNNKFKCFICSQPFLETNLLRAHMNESHTFAPLRRLVNNRRENILKVDVSEIMCKICTIPLPSLVELKTHLKQDHEKPIDPELKDNIIPFKLETTQGGYKCVVCDEHFIKVRILVIHMSVHFNNYSCEVCGSGFMTLRLLKKHLEVHESGNFPCDRCSKVFSTAYKRTLHIRGVHMKQYPRRCPICPERFNSNYKRTIHLQDVHNQSTRVHKCETCGRAFNLKYHLICHTRSVHLQERNQQCDICHQRFCNKETLKRHMVIHTGEKNHKCEVCGMAFLRRKNLKDHLRHHEMN